MPNTEHWRKARQLFLSHGIHHLIITDGELQACGILSERDLLRYPQEDSPPVETLPVRKLVYATPDTDVRSIALFMLHHDVDAITVMSGNFIEGIITQKDLLKALFPQENFRNQV